MSWFLVDPSFSSALSMVNMKLSGCHGFVEGRMGCEILMKMLNILVQQFCTASSTGRKRKTANS